MTRMTRFNTEPLPLRLRVEDFLLLDAADAFADYAKTELIDGEIVTAATIQGLTISTGSL